MYTQPLAVYMARLNEALRCKCTPIETCDNCYGNYCEDCWDELKFGQCQTCQEEEWWRNSTGEWRWMVNGLGGLRTLLVKMTLLSEFPKNQCMNTFHCWRKNNDSDCLCQTSIYRPDGSHSMSWMWVWWQMNVYVARTYRCVSCGKTYLAYPLNPRCPQCG